GPVDDQEREVNGLALYAPDEHTCDRGGCVVCHARVGGNADGRRYTGQRGHGEGRRRRGRRSGSDRGLVAGEVARTGHRRGGPRPPRCAGGRAPRPRPRPGRGRAGPMAPGPVVALPPPEALAAVTITVLSATPAAATAHARVRNRVITCITNPTLCWPDTAWL